MKSIISSPKIFLSHSSRDIEAARELAKQLRLRGVDVWLDEEQICYGDSIPAKVSEGLEQCQFLLAVYSESARVSRWVSEEWAAAHMAVMERQHSCVVPVRLADVKLPILLAHRKQLDFFGTDRLTRLDDFCQQVLRSHNKQSHDERTLEFVTQLIRADYIENPDRIAIPENLGVQIASDADIGIITLGQKVFLLPAESAIQYAVLAEGRTSLESVSNYTRILKPRLSALLHGNRRFKEAHGHLSVIRIPPPRAVLFDWRRTLVEEDQFDDAICNTLPVGEQERQTYFAWLKELELAKDPKWYDYLLHCQELGHSFQHFSSLHYNNATLIHLMPHARDLLHALRKSGIQIGLITNCSDPSLELRMDIVDLERSLFDYVYTSSLSDQAGIKMRMLDRFLQESGFRPTECALVSDSLEKDIILGHNIGFRTIWFFNPRHYHRNTWGTPELLVPQEFLNAQLTLVRDRIPFDYIITGLSQIFSIWQL